jgi:hypothetical protein
MKATTRQFNHLLLRIIVQSRKAPAPAHGAGSKCFREHDQVWHNTLQHL